MFSFEVYLCVFLHGYYNYNTNKSICQTLCVDRLTPRCYTPNMERKGDFMSKFVIRAVNSGMKFDLKAANGETIATSEVYTGENACLRGIESVRKNAPGAELEDQTAQPELKIRCPKFQLYEDKRGDFRFRLKAHNGKIIAVSEGYTSKASCLGGIESVRKNAPDAEILLVE